MGQDSTPDPSDDEESLPVQKKKKIASLTNPLDDEEYALADQLVNKMINNTQDIQAGPQACGDSHNIGIQSDAGDGRDSRDSRDSEDEKDEGDKKVWRLTHPYSTTMEYFFLLFI